MSNKRFWFNPKSAVLPLLALAGICLGQSKWEWGNPFPTRDNLNSVTYGNKQYVAVGSRGTIITSPDGATWATSSSGTNKKINYVINANNQFVAVGDSGTILTSPDGANWATKRAGTTMNLNSVVHGNSQFVVVGDSSTILTSPDGSKWTKQSLDSVYNLKSLTFGDNLFVALSDNGTALTSSDGTTWTKRNSLLIDPSQIGEGFYWSTRSYYSIKSVAYGNHQFVAVGDSIRFRFKSSSPSFPVILTSPDGITWTKTTLVKDSVYHSSFMSLTYADGRFVAIKDSTILSSTDGTSWTVINSGTKFNNYSFNYYPFIAYGKDQFVVVGEGGMIKTSSDCSNWVDRRSLLPVYISSMVYGKNRFVALGSRNSIATSNDGKTWTKVNYTPSDVNTALLSIAYGNDRFVVVGSNGLVMTSTDGIEWTEKYFHHSLNSVIYGKDKFVIVGGDGKVLTSTDGAAWTIKSVIWTIENPGIYFVGNDGNSIAYGNNRFVAIVGKNDSYYRKIATSADGITWTERDFGSGFTSIIYNNNQFVATVSGSDMFLSSFDGITWTTHSTGANNELKSVLFANNQFVAVGHYGTLLTSTDGNTWLKEYLDYTCNLNTVAYGNDRFVVAGNIILVSKTKNDNPIKATYIGNGTIEFEATFTTPQQYVEVFSRQNGVQNVAQNIVGSAVYNSDGTVTYKLTRSGYTSGDVVEYRFYSHAQNSPAVFTPGPTENSWSSLTIKSSKATYTGNGTIVFEATFATPRQYVEIISRQNGLQNVAQNIVGNVVNNNDGTVTYKLTRGGYNEGDNVEFRFYSYAQNSPAVFTPGPVENSWDNMIVAK